MADLPIEFNYVPTNVPPAILRLARNSWSEPDLLFDNEHLVLPSATWLRSIISTCVDASLRREEQRAIRCRILIEPNRKDPADYSDFNYSNTLLFKNNEVLTSENLVRIAPAIDRRNGLLIIGPRGKRQSEIRGLSYIPVSLGRTQRRIGPNQLNNRLTVKILGPAKLEFSLGNSQLCILNGQRVEKPPEDVLNTPPIRRFFLPAAARVTEFWREAPSFLRSELRPLTRSDHPNDITRMLLERFISLTRGVVLKIAAMRHGGLLVFCPLDLMTKYVSANSQIVAVKHAWHRDTPDARVRSLLTDLAIEAGRLKRDQVDLKHPLAQSESEERAEGYRISMSRIANIDAVIADVSDRIAMYSAVDGGVVLSDDFEVVGFGAVIQNPGNEPTHAFKAVIVDGQIKKYIPFDPASRGTRHRAALRLCNSAPEVLVAVVSQDGDIRFVMNMEGKVVVLEQIQHSDA